MSAPSGQTSVRPVNCASTVSPGGMLSPPAAVASGVRVDVIPSDAVIVISLILAPAALVNETVN